jgi:hypothetical protein
MTQFFDGTGALVTHVFKGDRLWKYVCSGAGCVGAHTKRLVDQWRPVRNQLAWATSVRTKYTGVCDWGFDAAVQNSAYAFNALRETTGSYHKSRYAKLHAKRRLTERPYFPPVQRGARWRFTEDLTAADTMATGAGCVADNWQHLDTNGQPTPFAGMYTRSMQTRAHWWHNMLAAYNAAIAFLLLTDAPFLSPFE